MKHAASRARDNRMDSRPSVLSIDANASNQALIERVLSPQYEVLKAMSAAEGLEALFAFHPDLILLDVDMGNLNGLHLCRMIRSEPQFAQTPVLFVSGRTDDDRQQCFQVGGDDWLPKPLEVDTLAERIELNIERAKNRAACTEQNGDTPGLDESTQYLTQFMIALLRHNRADEVCAAILAVLDKLGLKGALYRHHDSRVFSSIGSLTDLERVLLEQAQQPYPPDYSGRFLWGSSNFGAIIHNMPSIRDALHVRTQQLLNTIFGAADNKLELLLHDRDHARTSETDFCGKTAAVNRHRAIDEYNLNVHGFKLECALEELEHINERQLGLLAQDLKALAQRLPLPERDVRRIDRLTQRCSEIRTALYAQCLEAQSQYTRIMADIGCAEPSDS